MATTPYSLHTFYKCKMAYRNRKTVSCLFSDADIKLNYKIFRVRPVFEYTFVLFSSGVCQQRYYGCRRSSHLRQL